MYRDKRDYRAIAFNTPAVKVQKDILEILSNKSIVNIEIIPSAEEEIEVCRCHYLRNTPYKTTPDSDYHRIKDTKTGKYKYDMYLIKYGKVKPLIIAAAPFMEMAKDIFGQIHKGMQGKEMLYQVIDFEMLFKKLENNLEESPSIRIDQMKFRVDGDERLDQLEFSGEDILGSFCYPAIRKTLKSKKGIELVPIGCRINYRNPVGKKFWLQNDSLGNMVFHVSKDAHNIQRIKYILTFLAKSGVVQFTSAYPLREKGKLQEEDE